MKAYTTAAALALVLGLVGLALLFVLRAEKGGSKVKERHEVVQKLLA